MLVSLRNSSSELPERLSPGPQHSVRFQNKSEAHSSQMHIGIFYFSQQNYDLGSQQNYDLGEAFSSTLLLL